MGLSFVYAAGPCQPRNGHGPIVNISRDRYPASLFARRLGLQKTCHVLTVYCCDVTGDTENTGSSIVA
jgi:hypothetical protein